MSDQLLNQLNVMSNWMFAAPVAGASKRPNIRFEAIGNVPRITVRTNVEGDKDYGKIMFKTDLPTFIVATDYALELANKPIPTDDNDPDEVRNFDYIDDFVAGRKLDKPIILTTLQIGRDKETKRIYMAVLAPQSQNRPRIQFFFGPSKYHAVRDRKGAVVSQAEMSARYCKGFVRGMSEVVMHLLNTQFDPEAKNVAKPGPGKPGGKPQGGGNRHNGGGGHSAPASNGGFDDSFDEEIPLF